MKNTVQEVKTFKIHSIRPCEKITANIRFIAEVDRRIDEAIPYLFLKFPPAWTKYSKKTNVLILEIWDRMITLFPSGQIGVTNTAGMDEARQILEKIRQEINAALEQYRIHGLPKPEEVNALRELSGMKLYNLLPKTNCGLCGVPTCMAFAFKVLANELPLNQCELLKTSAFSNLVAKMQANLGELILRCLGWNP